ncbi:MAG: aminoacyl-tRNA hydrolase [Melioribacteraceae bacterium]|nr:aminoacyl-tRNA hydrolase [Melioribacteraceae bacterium]MDD3557108.1 aminoacyl-tRNA hydrolase [Melioribacteraceae bacterium]
MRIIFGIGNPGSKYNNTRHNIGFLILDRLANKLDIEFQPSKYDYYFAGSSSSASPFFLVKPTTYVNLSGNAAVDIINNYDVDPKDFLVVTDDLNLKQGKIRIRQAGGDGGHNGISSIIYNLGDDNFPRLRFGIGRKFNQGEMKNFVLSKFTKEELESLEPNLNFAENLITEFIKDGFQAMLDYNSKHANSLNNSNNSEVK